MKSLSLLSIGAALWATTLVIPVSPSPAVALESGGAIVGHVRFLAEPPEPERVRIERDNDTCGLRKFSQEFIVSEENKGLQNVVLSVFDAPTAEAPADAENPILKQVGCDYVPRVQTAVVGQTLEILNGDPLLHNIHAYDEDRKTLFNWAQPIQNLKNKKKLDQEGVMSVQCDVHRWMQAYVVVSPHPYTAVTGEDGSFRIEGMPPGTYQLRAWHEGLGELDKDVTVTAGGEVTVNFDVGK